jgi:1-deoxy-D-xylulose-5-phosphate reductoisomerase
LVGWRVLVLQTFRQSQDSDKSTKQNVCILGATGSIGESTLKVLSLHSDQYQVFALSGHSRLDQLAEQCAKYHPTYVSVPADKGEQFVSDLKRRFPEVKIPTILEGEVGLKQIAAHVDVDVVMAAIVGAAGLEPTLAAVQAGKRVLLANKEALVMAGSLFMDCVRSSGAMLLPVDSEHNAIFQCLPADYFQTTERFQQQASRGGVSQILLTASGGPFRQLTAEQLERVTPEQACKHPNWVMGQKISVDSATLMNKGLELIEACHLFDLPPERVTVVVHPQSIIHSLVQYVDGSTLAQMGNPDMCTPIAHALAWPKRIDAGVVPLDLFQVATLSFEKPDEVRFPCLRLAREAMQAGGTTPAVLNAANEIAVAAFLAKKIKFCDIPRIIQSVITQLPMIAARDLATILHYDATARQIAHNLL